MLKIYQSGMFWYCWISYVDVILKLIVILGIASSNDKWLCFNSKLRYCNAHGIVSVLVSQWTFYYPIILLGATKQVS